MSSLQNHGEVPAHAATDSYVWFHGYGAAGSVSMFKDHVTSTSDTDVTGLNSCLGPH